MDNATTHRSSDRSALEAHSVWVCAIATKRVARKPSEPLRPLLIGIATAVVLVASLLTTTASFGSAHRSGYGITSSSAE